MQGKPYSFAAHFTSLNEVRKPLYKTGQNSYPSGVLNYNINDVLNRQENRPKQSTTTVPQKEVLLILPILGFKQSPHQTTEGLHQ